MLTLAGPCSIASLIRAGTAGANALNLGSAHLRLSGTLNGTGITVTTAGGRIDAQGTGRVTAVDCSATGRLVVYRAKDASKRIVGWNQDGCTNVRHYPRRIISGGAGLVIP